MDLGKGASDCKQWLSIIFGEPLAGKWVGCKISKQGQLTRFKRIREYPDHDCYINLADVSPTFERDRSKTRKQDMTGTRWVWCDIDPSTESEDSDEWRASTFKKLSNTNLVHYIIDSGRGFWAVAQLNRVAVPEEAELLVRAYGQFITDQTGVQYDKQAVDICRLVRLPGTTNQKTGRQAQFFKIAEGQIDVDAWIKELQSKIQEPVTLVKPAVTAGTIQEAVQNFHADNGVNLGVCSELAAQVEHLQGKQSGNYLEWAVEGRTSSSKSGLTCKLSTGQFHIHSETLSRRFGIANPSADRSYDLLDLCIMAKHSTGGPGFEHGKYRAEFLREHGYLRKRSKWGRKLSPQKIALSEDKQEQAVSIAAGYRVPDKLYGGHVDIWGEAPWLEAVKIAAQKNRASPSGVLFSVLARCGAAAGGANMGGVSRIGFSQRIPLSLYVVLSGEVGQGKSLTIKTASSYCPQTGLIPKERDGISVVSASALAESFVKGRDPETGEQQGQYDSAVLIYDEGDTSSGRSAAEHGLSSGLRELWSGGTMKHIRVDQARTRSVENVGVGLLMGVQPGNKCAIVDDKWGLNERALYATLYDPKRPSIKQRHELEEPAAVMPIGRDVQVLCEEADAHIEQVQDAHLDARDVPKWATALSRPHEDLNLMRLAAIVSRINSQNQFDNNTVEMESFRLALLLMEMSHHARLLHESKQAKYREVSKKQATRSKAQDKVEQEFEEKRIKDQYKFQRLMSRILELTSGGPKTISEMKRDNFKRDTWAKNNIMVACEKLAAFKRIEMTYPQANSVLVTNAQEKS